ncbi:hypothetical protein ACJ2PR_32395 [Phormidesmis sp. 146-33]
MNLLHVLRLHEQSVWLDGFNREYELNSKRDRSYALSNCCN